MMRNIFILAGIVLLLQCSTADKRKQQLPQKSTGSSEISEDWHQYSTALYYLSIKDYKTAISYFMDAAVHKKELHRIYYHLSECYHYQLDFHSAINYAKMAIEQDKQYIKPYFLLYKMHLQMKNFEKASLVLEDLLEIRPFLLQMHFRLAMHYYSRMNNYEKALGVFQNILEIGKTTYIDDYYREYAYYYIAYIYYRKNQIDRSINFFKKAVAINPDNDSAVYMVALLLMRTYDLDGASWYIRQYLRKYPGNIKMNSYLGRILLIKEDFNAAEYLRTAKYSKSADGFIAHALYLEIMKKDVTAQKGLQIIRTRFPRLISSYIALGRISLRKKDKKDALREFFTAGILLYKVKQYEPARACFIKALSINDTIAEIYYYLGRVYEDSGNINLALINYKKTNELMPRIDLLIHIGYLYSQKDKYDDALKCFDRAIEKEPDNPRAYFIKGIVYSKKKDYLQAEIFLNKAIAISKSGTYYFYLATVQEKQKKLKDAIGSLKTALQHDVANARINNYLGYLYADNNINLRESITLISKALKADPSNGAYLDSLGWAYYRLGKYRKALKKLLEAERQLDLVRTPDAVVYDHIADTHRKIGNHEQAIEYWRKSLLLEKNKKITEKIRLSERYINGKHQNK